MSLIPKDLTVSLRFGSWKAAQWWEMCSVLSPPFPAQPGLHLPVVDTTNLRDVPVSGMAPGPGCTGEWKMWSFIPWSTFQWERAPVRMLIAIKAGQQSPLIRGFTFRCFCHMFQLPWSEIAKWKILEITQVLNVTLF